MTGYWRCGFLVLAVCTPAWAAAPPAATKPDPTVIQSPAALQERIKTQLRVTRPDYVVFVPEVTERSRERHGQRALPGLRRPRRLADGHLDAEHRRGPAGPAHRVRPEPRRGPHLEPAADHCRAGEGGRGPHGELGLSAGEPIGTDLRALQPERGQVRHVPAHDRASGRHLQRRQRPDLVDAADRAAAAQHPRQPGPELPAAIGSAGRSRSGWPRTAATWPA